MLDKVSILTNNNEVRQVERRGMIRLKSSMLTTNKLLQKKGENIRRMFFSIASRYDFLNALLSFTFDRRWRKFAVSVSGVHEGDKVLDVCTGTGDLAIEYAKAIPPPYPSRGEGKVGVAVVGTDFCDEMLRLALCKIKNTPSPYPSPLWGED